MSQRTPWGDIAPRRRQLAPAPIVDDTDTALVRYLRPQRRRRWLPLWCALAGFALFAALVGGASLA